MSNPSEEQVLHQKKAQLLHFKQEYDTLKKTLINFPDQQKQQTKPSLIPYGKVAFLEGKFDAPEDVFVALGAEYFAKYSTTEALEVLDRRLKLVEDMLKDVEDELEIFEITKKLQLFSPEAELELPEVSEDAEASAFDIREEWTEEDEAHFVQKTGRKAHSQTTEKPKKHVSFSPEVQKQPSPGAPKPHVAVKERIVERKSSRPVDPMLTSTMKQAKESLFRKTIRKAAAEDPDVEETFSPNSWVVELGQSVMMIVHFLSVLVIVAAAHSKPIAKKAGLAATPKRNVPGANKLAVTKAKAPLKRTPLKNPIVSAKQPVANKTAPKLTANKTANLKKPATNKIAPFRKPATKTPALTTKQLNSKPSPAKRATPIKKIIGSKKPTPFSTKKPISVNKPEKVTPTRKAAAGKAKGKMPSPQATGIARTKSHLEAAMAYMNAQVPIEKSGDRKIEDLLASPSEAQKVEPFYPEKFFQARSDKIKEKEKRENRSKAQTGTAHGKCFPSWISILGIVTILLI